MKDVKIFYYYTKPNFGDQLNLTLLEKLFQKKGNLSHPTKAQLCMIGSILEPLIINKPTFKGTLKKNIFPPLAIFGSGFLTDPKQSKESYVRKLEVCATRGKLTRDRLSKNLHRDLSKIPLGDPGLLTSKIFDPSTVNKKFQVGIIPHMHNWEDTLLNKLKSKVDNSIIINPLDTVENVIKQISQCETILSNAMHGLIVADSLGIPNKRLILTKELNGGIYKFHDYYSAFDMETLPQVLDLRDATDAEIASSIENIKKDYSISYDQIHEIQHKLLENSPRFLN